MLKIEEAMYVRTRKGIAKILEDNGEYLTVDKNGTIHNDCSFNEYIKKEDIVKASYNIINLIEEGDYVNGERIQFITNKKQLLTDGGYDIFRKYEDIKTILTKEQYENNCYKLEE